MRVLLTGAFGAVGPHVRHELARRGHQVECFDLASRTNRQTARRAGASVTWGDIRSPGAIARAVSGQDVVIHLAAVLPPASELRPARAHEVNVVGTRNLLAALQAQPHPPRLVYASTAALFGPTQHLPPPRTAADPTLPSDHYTRQKAEAESLIRACPLEWSILRIGPVVPVHIPRRNPRATLRAMFAVPLDQRIELVHARDLGLALARAAVSGEAWGRTLLIGGGPSCRIWQREFIAASLDAIGIGLPADAAFSAGPYYTDWLDTAESQRLLQYQRHSFADYRAELERSHARLKPLVRWAGPLIRRFLAAQSPYRASV